MAVTPASAANPTSTAMGGYVVAVTNPDAAAQAGATFTVPTITCTSANSAIFIGVAITSPVIVSGLGTTTEAGITASCSHGAASYRIAATAAGSGVPGELATVDSGDMIHVAVYETPFVSQNKRGLSSTRFDDVTLGRTVTSTVRDGNNHFTVMEGVTAVDRSNGNPAPVPDFGQVTLSAAKEQQTTPAAAGATATDLFDPSNLAEVHTGPLDRPGNKWTETYKSA